MFGLSELAIILVVVIAVIGVKKLPELTRSAGKAARILKAEARAAKDEEAGTAPAPKVVRGEVVPPGTGTTPPGAAPRTTPDPARGDYSVRSRRSDTSLTKRAGSLG
jgi:sec-independent protein translocase protein TatA